MNVLLVMLAGILWGSMSIFVNGLGNKGFGLTSFEILFIRSLLTSLILGLIILIKDRSQLKIRLKDLWMFAGTGFMSLAFFSVCYFNSIQLCGAGVSVALLYTSPVFILVLSSLFFKEQITKSKIAAIILTMAGVFFVSEAGGNGTVTVNDNFTKGVILGICSGLGYGLYSIFGTVALKKYKVLTVTFYTFVLAGIAMIPFIIPFELFSKVQAFLIDDTLTSINYSSLIRFILLTCGIAIFCTVLPFVFYTIGLSHIEAGKAGIIVTIEPLAGCLLGFFLWKEEISVFKIAGILFIFAAVFVCSWDTIENFIKECILKKSDKKLVE